MTDAERADQAERHYKMIIDAITPLIPLMKANGVDVSNLKNVLLEVTSDLLGNLQDAVQSLKAELA